MAIEIELDWLNPNTEPTTVKIYKGLEPFTKETLPPVLVSLEGKDIIDRYIDKEVVENKTYYYMLSCQYEDQVWYSECLSIVEENTSNSPTIYFNLIFESTTLNVTSNEALAILNSQTITINDIVYQGTEGLSVLVGTYTDLIGTVEEGTSKIGYVMRAKPGTFTSNTKIKIDITNGNENSDLKLVLPSDVNPSFVYLNNDRTIFEGYLAPSNVVSLLDCSTATSSAVFLTIPDVEDERGVTVSFTEYNSDTSSFVNHINTSLHRPDLVEVLEEATNWQVTRLTNGLLIESVRFSEEPVLWRLTSSLPLFGYQYYRIFYLNNEQVSEAKSLGYIIEENLDEFRIPTDELNLDFCLASDEILS